MNHIIGIAEMKVTNQPDDVLVTYSLGSCIGLTLYDPVAQVGGIIHCMLPVSKIDPAKAAEKPLMFTDTGATMLIQKTFDMGAERHRLIAKVAGASSMFDDQGLFKISERNYTMLRKVLWKNSILIAAEDVGGSMARTMVLYMQNGKTTIKSGGIEKEL